MNEFCPGMLFIFPCDSNLYSKLDSFADKDIGAIRLILVRFL